MEGRIIINNYIENDPLSEENLDNTLNFLHEFCLSLPEKTIWIYSGYTWEETMEYPIAYDEEGAFFFLENDKKRYQIISRCNVFVDGRYIDSQRNIAKKWAGSNNQRVIDVQQTLQKGEIILWAT